MSVVPDRLYHMGGIPVGETINPTFGKVLFVDATNGTVSGDGSADLPFSTIALALAAQNTDSATSLGDVIYVMPGAYAEHVTTAMTRVQIIGATCGGTPAAVYMAPTTSHAYVGAMTSAAFRNMAFKTPATSDTDYAAVSITPMTHSVIDNCRFLGQINTANTLGLLLGAQANTADEYHQYSEITNNEFTTWMGRNCELDNGIVVGASNTNNASRILKSCLIANNRIFAEFQAIYLFTGASNTGGSVISGNTISSHQGGNGPNNGIYSSNVDELCMVTDNRIAAISDCIRNFAACNTMGNIVAQAGGTPTQEWPHTT